MEKSDLRCLKEYKLEDVDKIIDILYRLRAMMGAFLYLMNGAGEFRDPPDQYIETWLGDVGDRLDEAIKIL